MRVDGMRRAGRISLLIASGFLWGFFLVWIEFKKQVHLLRDWGRCWTFKEKEDMKWKSEGTKGEIELSGSQSVETAGGGSQWQEPSWSTVFSGHPGLPAPLWPHADSCASTLWVLAAPLRGPLLLCTAWPTPSCSQSGFRRRLRHDVHLTVPFKVPSRYSPTPLGQFCLLFRHSSY